MRRYYKTKKSFRWKHKKHCDGLSNDAFDMKETASKNSDCGSFTLVVKASSDKNGEVADPKLLMIKIIMYIAGRCYVSSSDVEVEPGAEDKIKTFGTHIINAKVTKTYTKNWNGTLTLIVKESGLWE